MTTSKSPRLSLLEALQSGRVLLMDGAMGTELQRRGIRSGECFEQWNLTRSSEVRDVHQAYCEAGAKCITTNTFQSNPLALARHGLVDRFIEINQAALRVARSVAGADGFVLADIGPISSCTTSREMAAALRLTVSSLSGADAFLLETWPRPPDGGIFVDSVQGAAAILFSLTWGDPRISSEPVPPPRVLQEVVAWAKAYDIAALGVNCGRNMNLTAIIETIRRYRLLTELPLFARPNAGTPVHQGDEFIYPETPERMAARVPELLEAGVSMIGGCCGTTPAHIAAFRPIVERWSESRMRK